MPPHKIILESAIDWRPRQKYSLCLILRRRLKLNLDSMPLKRITEPLFKVRFASHKTCEHVLISTAGISVGAYNVGCFFGAITTIFIGNPLGRRKTIFLGSSIMIVGAALQCSSYSLGQFISGRLITG